MLRLGEIRNARGAHREEKRRGRGAGSGHGGTSGKGNKGQLARSGGKVRRGFEGGQMPLYRRVPKRGFTNIFRKDFAIVNIGDINKAMGLTEITLASLKDAGVLKTKLAALKVLGTGEISRAVKVKADAISEAAKQKIEKAGGSVEISS